MCSRRCAGAGQGMSEQARRRERVQARARAAIVIHPGRCPGSGIARGSARQCGGVQVWCAGRCPARGGNGPQISMHNYAAAGPTQPVSVGSVSEWCSGDRGMVVLFVRRRRRLVGLYLHSERREGDAVSPWGMSSGGASRWLMEHSRRSGGATASDETQWLVVLKGFKASQHHFPHPLEKAACRARCWCV